MKLEIIGPEGAVHYTRPHDHPDVWEALNTPGYSVRGTGEKHAFASLHADCNDALLGIIGVCEAYQNLDFEGMDDDRKVDVGWECSQAVIRMASAALRENTAQFTFECLCRKCGKQFQLPSKDAPHICPICQ